MVAARAYQSDIDERRTRVMQMYNAGDSVSHIARTLEVSRTTVRKDVAYVTTRLVAEQKTEADKKKEPLVGGRITVDSSGTSIFGDLQTVIEPTDHESAWQLITVNRADLMNKKPSELLEIMVNLSPEISRGLWDFLLLMNPGHNIRALNPVTRQPDDNAQVYLDTFLSTLDDRHGARDVLFAKTNFSAMLRGAFFNELVLDKSARIPLNIVAPDPISVRFRKVKDPELGDTYEMGQFQGNDFVVLNSPTIKYVPVHPAPGSPYGRSMITPALFPSMFLMGLFHDLRRVIAQQGYPRLDIEINTEAILTTLGSLRSDQDKVDLMASVIAQVRNEYQAMQPDDTYVHSDAIKINRPVGTLDSSSLAAANSVIQALERLATRALKSMPLLMGINEGTSEANANRQWEIFSKGIKTMQHLHEQMLSSLLQIAMEAQGIACLVDVEFMELRASEEQRDELTFKGRIENAVMARNEGFWTQEQASAHAVHEMPYKSQADIDKEAEDAAAAAEDAAKPSDGVDTKPTDDPAVAPDDLKPNPDEDRMIRSEVDFSVGEIDLAVAAFNYANPSHWGLIDAVVIEADPDNARLVHE